MRITIQVPSVLREYCGSRSTISVSASTVRNALEQLATSEPALYRSVCDEAGAMRRHVNVFVNTSHVRERDGLDTELKSGDVIHILPAVSGG